VSEYESQSYRSLREWPNAEAEATEAAPDMAPDDFGVRSHTDERGN